MSGSLEISVDTAEAPVVSGVSEQMRAIHMDTSALSVLESLSPLEMGLTPRSSLSWLQQLLLLQLRSLLLRPRLPGKLPTLSSLGKAMCFV